VRLDMAVHRSLPAMATDPAPARGSADPAPARGSADPAPARGSAARGRIVLVGTPIGNLGDLSPRAAETLADADVVCCEDTRHTRKLLSASGIAGVRLVALHEHNEAAAGAEMVRLAGSGALVAVVSDAGMPGISDPGERLVRAAVAAGVAVEVVPGPSAVVAALVVSGLRAERFCFEGFLPRKGGERRTRLAALAREERTTVIYEAPHRVSRTVADLAAACGGGRRVALVREITKRFEETWRGTLHEAVTHLADSEPRGEWVVVIDGAPAAEVDDADIAAALVEARGAGLARRAAVDEVADRLGVAPNRVYRLALSPGAPSPQGSATEAWPERRHGV
jgi:16S rRNA (cytidine1402-2'-O)-methyltransferase